MGDFVEWLSGRFDFDEKFRLAIDPEIVIGAAGRLAFFNDDLALVRG